MKTLSIHTLYKLLDQEPLNGKQRIELRFYLKEITTNLPEDSEDRREIAYGIAGLLSTAFARSLKTDDILEDILTLAGELEVPDPDDSHKWDEFKVLVRAL